jgi:hypothetical protein
MTTGKDESGLMEPRHPAAGPADDTRGVWLQEQEARLRQELERRRA